MRRYRVNLPLTVHTEDGAYTQGEEFEKEFSDEAELANVRDSHGHPNAALLTIVPVEYLVVAADSVVHDTPTGETFSASLLQGEERALLEGGAIEIVAEKPKRKKADKDT